jgi:hypothetical protein
MPNLQLVNFQVNDNKHYFTYANATPETVAHTLSNVMGSQGYKLETGDPYRGTYGVGSTVMRILFGAFVKRYTFDFQMQPSGDATVLEFRKGMTGWSGGVIGNAKMNTEFVRLTNVLKTI